MRDWVGKGAEAFRERLAPVLDGSLANLAENARKLAAMVRRVSFEVEYTKRIIIAQFAMLMALLAWLIPMLWFPFTSGWAASAIAALRAQMQLFLNTVWRRLLFSIVVGVLYQLVPDVGVQLHMKARHGDSYDWDWTKTGVSTLSGVIGGLIAPAMEGLGGLLGERFLKSVLWQIGSNAFHEWSTEVLVEQISRLWNDPDGRKHAGSEWSAVAGAMEGVRDALGMRTRGRLYRGKFGLDLKTMDGLKTGDGADTGPDAPKGDLVADDTTSSPGSTLAGSPSSSNTLLSSVRTPPVAPGPRPPARSGDALTDVAHTPIVGPARPMVTAPDAQVRPTSDASLRDASIALEPGGTVATPRANPALP